jgi:hypothetical protein
MHRHLILLLSSLAVLVPCAAQVSLEERKLLLDQQRLDFEQSKSALDRAEEKHKDLLSAISIGIPILLAVGAYVYQSVTKRGDEKLAFQLKAAELIMASRDTGQVRGKALLLAALFPNRLDAVHKALTEEKALPYFGRTNETREFLLEMLAKYPASREEIIRGWAILFPWDGVPDWNTDEDRRKSYKWFEALKADTLLNKNSRGRTESDSV